MNKYNDAELDSLKEKLKILETEKEIREEKKRIKNKIAELESEKSIIKKLIRIVWK